MNNYLDCQNYFDGALVALGLSDKIDAYVYELYDENTVQLGENKLHLAIRVENFKYAQDALKRIIESALSKATHDVPEAYQDLAASIREVISKIDLDNLPAFEGARPCNS